MKCDRCKVNDASFFKKITINGVTKESHLCEHCARIYNPFSDLEQKIDKAMDFGDDIFDFPFSNHTNLLDNFVDLEDNEDEIESLDDEIETDVDEPQYRQFDKKLDETVDEMKKIENGTYFKPINKEIDELNEKLAEALNTENYEEASRLKKIINDLKEKK